MTPDERRTRIAEAAIEVVGNDGMRGLTHRAVDARAGLPTGSTSYYFRTRAALVHAAVQRLADHDQAAFGPDRPQSGDGTPTESAPAESAPAGSAPAGSASADSPSAESPQADFAAAIAAALDDSLSRHRVRTMARYLFLLEAARDPDLAAVREIGRRFRDQATQNLRAAGAPDAEARARTLVAALDGLLFDRLANTGGLSAPTPGTPESVADLTAAVRLLLQVAGLR